MPPATAPALIRTEKLDLRITATDKLMLQSAAAVNGQSVSEFVLESALARASETLPDRQYFSLSAEQWSVFQTALEAPPRSLPQLNKLLHEPSIFE